MFLPFVFIFNENWKFIFLNTVFILILTFICFYILLQFEPAHKNISTYWNQQIVASISGNRPSEHSDSQFTIIFGTLQQLIIPLIITAAVLVFSKWRFNSIKPILPYLFTALAFSIPFTVFHKQHIYYIIPSLPFYALFLASIINIKLEDVLTSKKSRLLIMIGKTAFVIGIGFSIYNYGKFSRDKEMITDLLKVSNFVNEKPVTADAQIRNNWGLFANSARLKAVKFNVSTKNEFLISNSSISPNDFELVDLGTEKFHLHKKIK